VLVALALGTAGGAIFYALNMPLAWMLGAMCATTIAALAGIEVRVPPSARTGMIAILGVMLGSAFTPDIADRIGQWAGGLALQFLFVATVTGASLIYFRRVARFDPVTAYFAATPGGLNVMVIAGEELGGDPRAISLVHAIRILVVVFVVPFYFRVIVGLDVPSVPAGMGTMTSLGLSDAGILALCGVFGFLIARRLKIPAAGLVGPMALSIAAHLGGLTAAQPPLELVAVAQVVVGTGVGCRFVGVPLRQVGGMLGLAVGSSVMMLVLAGLFAFVAASLSTVPPTALFLSFAPGGLAEMSLIALALGIDTAFVSTMHVFRIVYIVMLAPLAFRLLGREREG
jgi:membrane AbrB-like protein